MSARQIDCRVKLFFHNNQYSTLIAIYFVELSNQYIISIAVKRFFRLHSTFSLVIFNFIYSTILNFATQTTTTTARYDDGNCFFPNIYVV